MSLPEHYRFPQKRFYFLNLSLSCANFQFWVLNPIPAGRRTPGTQCFLEMYKSISLNFFTLPCFVYSSFFPFQFSQGTDFE